MFRLLPQLFKQINSGTIQRNIAFCKHSFDLLKTGNKFPVCRPEQLLGGGTLTVTGQICHGKQKVAKLLTKVLGVSRFEGIEHLDKVIMIDQSPIGRTPRSNPATYTGLFTEIRNLFAKTKDAKAKGYSAGRFSFNVRGGRCEACEGDGVKKIEMHFLPDVYVTCDVCKGKRYNRETLEVKYKGKSIYDVLEMNVEEALELLDVARMDGHKYYEPGHMYYDSTTQWSVVYNLSKCTASVCVKTDYEKVYKFSLFQEETK